MPHLPGRYFCCPSAFNLFHEDFVFWIFPLYFKRMEKTFRLKFNLYEFLLKSRIILIQQFLQFAVFNLYQRSSAFFISYVGKADFCIFLNQQSNVIFQQDAYRKYRETLDAIIQSFLQMLTENKSSSNFQF